MARDLFRLDHRGGRPPINDRHLSRLTELLQGLGPDARCAGLTAAALHGFDSYSLAPPFHFVLPRRTNRQRVGHVVHTSTVLPAIDCEVAWGLAVTAPTRTLIDLAVTESRQRLTVALDGALRDLQTTEPFLHSRFAGTRVVVELLGYRYHRTALQMQNDAARLNRLLLDGYLVVQFTYDDVVSRPSAVVATVIEALRTANAA